MILPAPTMKRSAAKSLGLVRYRNGKQCPQGHAADRFVSTGQCSECLKPVAKQWRGLYPEKVRGYTAKYYAQNSKLLNAKSRAWSKENKERHRKLNDLWHERNPEGNRIHAQRRRARLKNVSGSHTIAQIRGLYTAQKAKCAFCSCSIKGKYHIDHIYPISLGGSDDIKNIQLLCQTCNQRKYNKHPVVFAQENWKLL